MGTFALLGEHLSANDGALAMVPLGEQPWRYPGGLPDPQDSPLWTAKAIYLASSNGYIETDDELWLVAAGGAADLYAAEGPAMQGYVVPGRGGLRGAGGCSFAGETRVLMADGSVRPINEIKVGDLVLASDPETGEQAPQRVTHLWTHEDDVLALSVSSGTITTTEDHLYWDAVHQRWTRADELGVEAALTTADGNTVLVNGLNQNSRRSVIAYTLTVEDIHTFYVLAGRSSVLVHNCPGDGAVGGPKAGGGAPKIGPTSGRPNWQDGSVSPGQGWEWRGPGDPGTPNRGVWFKPDTKETLHPDLGHPAPIGPHYDYRAPDGTFYRIFPDGRVEPKK
ncbi:polymorphic toxin-type HINT domain-containing protein [Phytohabitans sp. LJ34]|uniref:polymorphic toxin-type HINT domain-containing protein n=1 Tax=Phytohabitans sp. LJ34 TaxID=3452217 RepID=UPI003F8B3AFE